MMNFDIEKLERKTPYKEPDQFFDSVQNKVLQQTIGQKKEVKMIPIYAKWAVAASITLFAGLSAFFISSQNEGTTIVQAPIIIDSTYNSNDIALEKKDIAEPPISTKEGLPETKDNLSSNQATVTKNDNNNNLKVSTQKPKASFAKSSSNADTKVNRALAVFTRDQISEMDKSIEQDIYLDLYN